MASDMSIDYDYDPQRQYDFNAYLTASQVKEYCRLFGIKISSNPSYFELQEAANQIGQRFQAISDEAFNIKPMK